MKKRLIKKAFHATMSDLLTATCVAGVQKDADTEKLGKIQETIFGVYADFNSRLSNYEKKNAKSFFKQFRAELNSQLEAIVDSINE